MNCRMATGTIRACVAGVDVDAARTGTRPAGLDAWSAVALQVAD